MMLLVEGADLFSKNPRKICTFHTASFWENVKILLTDLKELYERHWWVEHAFFHLFLAVRLQATQHPSRSVKALSMNNITLFNYDLRDKKSRWEERASILQMHLITCVERNRAPCHEVTKTLRDAICATEEWSQLRPKRWRAGASSWRKEVMIKMKKRRKIMQHYSSPPQRRRRCLPSCDADQSKHEEYADEKWSQKGAGVIKGRGMSFGLSRSKWSHDPASASQFACFED